MIAVWGAVALINFVSDVGCALLRVIVCFLLVISCFWVSSDFWCWRWLIAWFRLRRVLSFVTSTRIVWENGVCVCSLVVRCIFVASSLKYWSRGFLPLAPSEVLFRNVFFANLDRSLGGLCESVVLPRSTIALLPRGVRVLGLRILVSLFLKSPMMVPCRCNLQG